MSYQDESELPKYRLIKPFYADDAMFEEGTELLFDGIPNEQMEPLNEPARRKLSAYISYLRSLPVGGKTKPVEELVHEALMRGSGNMEDVVREVLAKITASKQGAPVDPSHVVLPKADNAVPLMGTIPGLQTRGRGRPRKTVAAAAMPTEPKGPRKVIGTVITEKSDDTGFPNEGV